MHGTVPPPRPPRSSLPRAAHLCAKLPRVAYLPALPNNDARQQIRTMCRGQLPRVAYLPTLPNNDARQQIGTMRRGRIDPDLDRPVRPALGVVKCAASSRSAPIAAIEFVTRSVLGIGPLDGAADEPGQHLTFAGTRGDPASVDASCRKRRVGAVGGSRDSLRPVRPPLQPGRTAYGANSYELHPKLSPDGLCRAGKRSERD